MIRRLYKYLTVAPLLFSYSVSFFLVTWKPLHHLWMPVVTRSFAAFRCVSRCCGPRAVLQRHPLSCLSNAPSGTKTASVFCFGAWWRCNKEDGAAQAFECCRNPHVLTIVNASWRRLKVDTLQLKTTQHCTALHNTHLRLSYSGLSLKYKSN